MKRSAVVFLLAVSICLTFAGVAVSSVKSVIVGFHQKPGLSEKALIHGARGVIKRTYSLIPAIAVSLPEQAIAYVKKNKEVAYVEEDGIFRAAEPLLGNEYVNSWGVQHIRAEVAHYSGNKGAGVRIAVIDTGIDYMHQDLNDNFMGGYDFVFNDDDPIDDNFRSHGTHVAGIIAGEDNGIGVIGVAPEAELYAVKVLDGAGFGLLSWIIAGIQWAVNNQMDIANLSLEGMHFQSLQDACDNAYSAGLLLVAAGGNTNGGSVRYPAAYGSVISVTGTDAFDMKAYFSPVSPEVEIAAPGVGIWSTVLGGGWDFLSGTSQAAPHVAGTAALFLTSDVQDVSGDGMINHEDVRLMLQTTAVDLGGEGRDDVYGFGLVDASKAAFTVPLTDIKANGSDGPVTIIQSDTLSVTVQLDSAGLAGEDADWWVVASTPFSPPNDWYYYDLTLDWQPGLDVTYQGALIDLPPYEVMNMFGLPQGTYTFYFGVDMIMNGSLDMGDIYYDSVGVTITR